jgi:hypothetical protein
MIREHRDSESKGVLQPDLLYTLLLAQDMEAGIGRMTDIQLRDEVMTIFWRVMKLHPMLSRGLFIYYLSIQLWTIAYTMNSNLY